MEQVIVPEPAGNTQVCIAAQEQVSHPPAVYHLEAQLDVGMEGVETGQGIRQHVYADRCVTRNADRPSPNAGNVVQCFACLAHEGQNSPRALVEGRTDRRQLEGSPAWLQQGVPERSGQGLDLVGHGRLAERKGLGRSGDSLEVDDGFEDPELVEGEPTLQR